MTRLPPETPSATARLLDDALKAHQIGRLELAEQLYQAILAQDGLHADSLHLLGVVALQRGQLEGAIRQIRAAITADPTAAPFYANLGEAQRRHTLLDPAASNLRRALAIAPSLADARHNLGLTLLHLREMDQGRTLILEAIRQAPRPVYYYSLTDTGPIRGDDPSIIADMKRAIENIATASADERATLHIALGRALNARGEGDEAFRHLLIGNRLRRSANPYDEKRTLGLFQRIEASFPLSPATASGKEHGPVFILGMPRSGSSLVEQILASHPHMFGAGEIDLFARAVTTLQPTGFPEEMSGAAIEPWQAVGEFYRKTISSLAPGRRIINKMPMNYFFVGGISLALPDARIVHVLRDPVDTCLSCFSTIFGSPHTYSYDLGDLGRYYRAYSSLMSHWRRYLPRGTLLELRYEDLVADPETGVRRLLDHCGLDWDPACLSFHRSSKPVGTASLSQVRQPLNRSGIGRWRPSAAQLAPLLQALGSVQN